MTDEMMALRAMLEKGADADVLRGLCHINLSEARKMVTSADLHPSRRLADTRLLLPDGEGVSSVGLIFDRRHEVPTRMEMLVNRVMGGQELLSLAR